MATIWTLIEMCIADAHRAEDLTRDLVARRELRLDADSALAGFALWPGRTARGVRVAERRGDRRRLVHQQGRAEAQDAA
jgi:hypothetical protein